MAVIAVILMLFSQRAKMNGPVFLCGWALTLAVISTVVYLLADVGNVDTSSEAGKHRRVGLAPTRPERPLSC
jgi:hypothetical protein